MTTRFIKKDLKLPPDYLNELTMITSIKDLINEVKKYITKKNDIERIKEAAQFVKWKFRLIKRKDGSPFYNHLLTTGFFLAQWKCSPSMIIAGLLHDLIEDIEGETYKTINKRFGQEIAFLVDKVTKARLFEKSNQDMLGINMRKILLGMAKDVRVIVIKMADRLNNMLTLGNLSSHKQISYAKETLSTYVPIARALGFNDWVNKISNLCFWFIDQQQYLNLFFQIKKMSKNEMEIIDLAIAELKSNLLKEKNQFESIYGRQKSIYSINQKIKKGKEIQNIVDIFAIRIICKSINDCYAILGTIHQKYEVIKDRFKDYIVLPKGNMYQSLHTTVIINRFKYEIQIRTKEMHEIAEMGIAAHWKYKENVKYSYNKQHKEIADKVHLLRNIIKFDETNKESFTNDFEWWKELQEEILGETIICMTPKKKVIELKANSTILDFAFHIHTEIGLNAIKGVVNGTIRPLKTILETGDIVEIITSNKPNFSTKWLSWVTTPTAKNKLKKALKDKKTKTQKDLSLESIINGKNALKNYLDGANMLEIYQNNLGLINDFLINHFKVKNMDDVYKKFSKSKSHFNIVFNYIFTSFLTKEQKISFSKKKNSQLGTTDYEVIIDGIEGLKVELAKCCNPIYGDDIIALVSKRSGLKIHTKNCPNTKDITKYYDAFHATWGRKSKKTYKAYLLVESLNGSKAIDRVLSVLGSMNMKIENFHNKIIDNKKLLTEIEFYINSLKDLTLLIKKFEKFKDIFSVKRK